MELVGTLSQKYEYIVYGYIRNFQRDLSLRIPVDINNIILGYYKNDFSWNKKEITDDEAFEFDDNEQCTFRYLNTYDWHFCGNL